MIQEYFTTEEMADHYGVDIEVIERIVEENLEELKTELVNVPQLSLILRYVPEECNRTEEFENGDVRLTLLDGTTFVIPAKGVTVYSENALRTIGELLHK